MFGWVSDDLWIVYDAADVRSRHRLMTDKGFDDWLDSQAPDITCIIGYRTKAAAPLKARLGLWCVTAVKHTLGLSSGALRPKALKRDILRAGGREWDLDMVKRVKVQTPEESPEAKARRERAEAAAEKGNIDELTKEVSSSTSALLRRFGIRTAASGFGGGFASVVPSGGSGGASGSGGTGTGEVFPGFNERGGDIFSRTR